MDDKILKCEICGEPVEPNIPNNTKCAYYYFPEVDSDNFGIRAEHRWCRFKKGEVILLTDEEIEHYIKIGKITNGELLNLSFSKL